MREQYLEDTKAPRLSKVAHPPKATPARASKSKKARQKPAKKHFEGGETHSKRPPHDSSANTPKKVKVEQRQHFRSDTIHQILSWASSCSEGFPTSDRRELLHDFLTNFELTPTANHHLAESDINDLVAYAKRTVKSLDEGLLIPQLNLLNYHD